MENYPLLAPLVILVPSVGAFINFFWGKKMGEKLSGLTAIIAALIAFAVSIALFAFSNGTHGGAMVVDPPFFDGWLRIDSIGFDIPWQLRVDPISITMMLVVTGVGSLIHIYAVGYMHGDPKFPRFFAFLNMFLAFMLILVSGNNFLMMFVGWEGVGLCSYLLIGFWWDKAMPEGWKNSNAARKAFIVNRVGDFGLLMAMFLIFWTFGTLNYYSPGETANVPYAMEVNGFAESGYGESADGYGEAADGEYGAAEAAHGDDMTLEESKEAVHAEEAPADGHGEAAADDGHGEAAGDGYGEAADDGHGGHGEAVAMEDIDNSRIAPEQLGVFGQAAYLNSLPEGDPGRMIDFGTFALDIHDVLILITAFMLLGVTGKSAQIPLFVWLPDAMAGPTPVSALIHAATMVTAGVYLMVRSSVFFDIAVEVRFVVAVIGAVTALMAGFIALGQWDIKRVLAYSTISQLGFMVAAVGVGAYVAAIFHLATHAVFKALLFMGSGSVIHGVEHGHHHAHAHGHGHDDHGHDDHHDEAFDPQDMRNMGGLRSKMPVTYVTYLVGTLALAGIFPFAGFWSKDEILADAWHVGFVENHLEGFIVLALLLIAAGFTAFYMWRQIEMVFHGKPRTEASQQAPESSGWMTLPLVVLALLTVGVGFINVPKGTPLFSSFFKDYEFKHFLESAIPSVTLGESLYFNVPLALAALGLGIAAIFLARSIYGGNKAVVSDEKSLGRDPLQRSAALGALWSLANSRLYWDEMYFRILENPFNKAGAFLADVIDWNFWHDFFHDKIIGGTFNRLAAFLSKPIDVGIIDGAVNGVGWVTSRFSSRLRMSQTGYVRTYAVAFLIGVVAVVIIMLLPLFQNGS